MRTSTLFLLALLVVLLVAPLILLPEADFVGADQQAGEMVGEMAPDYEPWFEPLWTPPGPAVESLLFALQAAAGAGLIGYLFGLKRGERRRAADSSESEADHART